MDNSISDKMFTYIATSDFLTQSMINNYNNSFIVIGDEKQAFIPILNSYIGGVGKSSYSYIRSMIIDYNNQNTQTLSLDVDFVNQNKQFNILFTYYNGDSGNYYVYSDHDLTINPNTNIIKYDNFEGNLIGNADTATKLKQSISLWGNSFDGSSNIAGNIIPNENSKQTIGNESKHFSYAYIDSVVGHLYGEAETSKFAVTSELSDRTNKIYNINKSDSKDYELLFTENNGNDGIYTYTYVNSNLYYNPNTKQLKSTYFVGWLKGTSDDTIKLKNAKKINGTNFDGTIDITTTYWGNARNFNIKDYNNTYTGTTVSVHGDQNIVLNLPEVICADIYGNSYTSTYSTYTSYSYMATYSYLSYITNEYSESDILIFPITFASLSSSNNYYSYEYVTKNRNMTIPNNVAQLEALNPHNIDLIRFRGFQSGLYYLPKDSISNKNGTLFSTYFRGMLLGISSYTDALYTPRKINGTDFDGSIDITTTYWGNERKFRVNDYYNNHKGTEVSVHGDEDIVLNLPATIQANIEGNATYATTSELSDKTNKIYNIDKSDNIDYKLVFTRNDGGNAIYTYTYVNSSLYYNPKNKYLYSAYFIGWLNGTSNDTIKLKNAKKINGTNFDGTIDITTTYWGNARNITISDYHNTYSQTTNNVDGGSNFTLNLPSNIHANLHGNADTSTYATVSGISNNTQQVLITNKSTNKDYYILFAENISNTAYTYLYFDVDVTAGLKYNPSTNNFTTQYINAVTLFRGKVRASDQWGTL